MCGTDTTYTRNHCSTKKDDVKGRISKNNDFGGIPPIEEVEPLSCTILAGLEDDYVRYEILAQDITYKDARYDVLHWRENSFTSSERGYNNKSEEYAQCLINAPFRILKWVIINILDEKTSKEHKEIWKKIARQLRNIEIIAWGKRELSKDGKNIHYNLLLKTNHKESQIRKSLEKPLEGLKTRLYFKDIADTLDDKIGVVRYVLKTRNWRHKRTYFKKKCGLNQVITIGDFWEGKLKELKDNWNKERKAWLKENAAKIQLEQEARANAEREREALLEKEYEVARMMRKLKLDIANCRL